MQKLAYRLAAIAVIAFSSLAAKADPVTYTLTDVTFTNQPSWSVTGTVTIDPTSGYPAGSNFQLSTPGGTIDFSGIGWSNSGDPSQLHIFGGDAYNYLLTLSLPTPPLTVSNDVVSGGLVGYSGGLLCTDSNNVCPGFLSISYLSIVTGDDDNLYDLQTGSLVETSPTPEPSTLALLGTGLIGTCGAIRRRVRI
jgi:hypothetical protein